MDGERRLGMVLGAFAGDALALGVHWIYDPAEIDRVAAGGKIAAPLDPVADAAKWHPNRRAGELTHCGDQALVLLRSLAANGGAFDIVDFAERWRCMWSTYNGYVDHATKETLRNFTAGRPLATVGSVSDELAGAARIAPVVAALGDDVDGAVVAARAQTALTHSDPTVVAAADFFARLALAASEGADPLAEIDAAAAATRCAEVVDAVERARAAAGGGAPAPSEAELGIACGFPDAFPSTLFLLLRHAGDFEAALVENAMAGGDSAARGMLLGMVLGALHGAGAVPRAWIDCIVARDDLLGLLETIEEARAAPGNAEGAPSLIRSHQRF